MKNETTKPRKIKNVPSIVREHIAKEYPDRTLSFYTYIKNGIKQYGAECFTDKLLDIFQPEPLSFFENAK